MCVKGFECATFGACQELLSLVKVVKKWWPYLLRQSFKVRIDNNAK